MGGTEKPAAASTSETEGASAEPELPKFKALYSYAGKLIFYILKIHNPKMISKCEQSSAHASTADFFRDLFSKFFSIAYQGSDGRSLVFSCLLSLF